VSMYPRHACISAGLSQCGARVEAGRGREELLVTVPG
jgi:hypothetical protein